MNLETMDKTSVDGCLSIPHFLEVAGYSPYPWQIRLYTSLLAGRLPTRIDIPTGLGKTTVLLLYLLAQAQGIPIPRRLIYVVDRRAIVDQSALAIRNWIEHIQAIPTLRAAYDRMAAFPAPLPVAVGVLRGGFADDGAWRIDPARPTVLVGTVDMVGSRLLFSGYGDGISRRPLHAGLIGHDAALLLDEAHLSPGFAGLVHQVAGLQTDHTRPAFRVCTLSATLRSEPAVVLTQAEPNFAIDDQDLDHPGIRRRINASKHLCWSSVENSSKRTARIVELASRFETGSILIYVRAVADARTVANGLRKHLGMGKGARDRVGVLTGTLRGREREALTQSDLWKSFLPDRERTPRQFSRYLICTSAGEVGVDLDADHAVMDLSTFDGMVQRLGRVNRQGEGDAVVHIVYTEKEAADPTEKRKSESKKKATELTYKQRLEWARYCTFDILRDLSSASPAALRAVESSRADEASVSIATPVPLHPQTVELLSVTTARMETPALDLLLRGVTNQPQSPDVWLLWRWDVPHLVQAGEAAAEQALGLFRPLPDELARVSLPEARAILNAALGRLAPLPLPVLIRDVHGSLDIRELTAESPLPDLRYATIYLPPTAGALRDGLPDERAKETVEDLGDTDDRIRYLLDPENAPLVLPDWIAMANEIRIPLRTGDDEDAEPRQLVYAVRRLDPAVQDADDDTTRFAVTAQTVDEHCDRVAAAARVISIALGLPDNIVEALETAGRYHDDGKKRRVWQRSAGIPESGPPMAKSQRGRFDSRILAGYRHEFGSLADAERRLAKTPGNELALHLIAAHHGRARPGFPDPRQWDRDISSAEGRATARAVSARFGRLQAHHGPWHLAWLEALLKAADARVSANLDSREDADG